MQTGIQIALYSMLIVNVPPHTGMGKCMASYTRKMISDGVSLRSGKLGSQFGHSMILDILEYGIKVPFNCVGVSVRNG